MESLHQVCFLFFFLVSGSFLRGQSEPQILQELLSAQQDCWNAGDIECFMEAYWKSDKLKFVGGNGVTWGWDNTLENYRRRYPNRKAMGQLTFSILETAKISRKAYSMLGKFHLSREQELGDLEGYFTLIFRKIDGHWLIVSDHTSSSS